MSLSAKTVRTQIAHLRPLLSSCSLETIRKGQDKIGELMEARHRRQVMVRQHPFTHFQSAWILPRDERRPGVILYLHGGGYTCGNLEYAKGFGSTLAVETGTRVLCAAYRLAPEAPFPAALDDALEAYRYLLSKGFSPAHIALCGESAGGGLCYALCLRLKELALPLPSAVIAISPWTDLTASGPSYQENQEIDPTMTLEQLDFYAACYTTDRTDPLVSPLFGALEGMPPSLIFVGGDEIMRSDSELLHSKLLSCGCTSQLVVAPQRWHGYILYCLEEDRRDMESINRFLSRYMAPEQKLRWMRLDNAAKIYPAARRQNWSNVFRLSCTLHENIDRAVLENALDVTVRRFPSISARLRRGVFWYYLQQTPSAPEIRSDNSYPLTRMTAREMRKCALRVIVYENRIAIEVFHSLTDGNGALIFLKSLVAEYLQQKHGIRITPSCGVLGRLEEPAPEELEDSFLRYAGPRSASRQESTAWRIGGTPEADGFLHQTCLMLPVQDVLDMAHSYHVSLTTFLAAVMMQAIQNLQAEKVPEQKRRKPIKVLLPVNLRNLFPSRTLRNFALYVTPEIDPRLGSYSFQEICDAIHHRMGLELNAKQMGMKIAVNVNSERLAAVRILPLFVKNLVMKAVFDSVGEKKSCLSLSNLGRVTLPPEMEPYIQRFDFILGVQATAPYNCGALSYGDTLYINFIRNIREPELEYHFHNALKQLGLTAEVQSNQQ